MAEAQGQSKTEAPSQRRRDEARREGRVALSPELNGGAMLLVGVLGLWLGAQGLAVGLLRAMRTDLFVIRHAEFTASHAHRAAAALVARGGHLLGFYLGIVCVAGVAVTTLQVGFHVSVETLLPRWSKLSPSQGWARLLSAASFGRGIVALFKVAAVAVISGWVLHGRSAEIAALAAGNLATAVIQVWGIAMRLALAIAAALVLIGVVDYAMRRWKHEQSLWMTRQELKEELKREEGDPMTRARIRKLAREVASKRMMADVPTASVVVTNPTHLAIALRYDRAVMPAPRVVAKGAGHVARRIVEIARRHAVPVVERKPLARALYKSVQIGQNIPLALYYAVAEVLAYVYRLRAPAPEPPQEIGN